MHGSGPDERRNRSGGRRPAQRLSARCRCAEPETGDAGAAAFLHGPEGLFPTDIPTQTLGALREDQGHDDAEETVR